MVDETLAALEDLYRRSNDPWGTTTRWYERRKRALLMASLAQERYGVVYEAGCGTGHISLELADRADSLLVSDASEAALAIARAALRERTNVTVERHRLPDDWPHRPFDLIVLGEMLYFVDDARRETIAAAARGSAGHHGEVVACDWRDVIAGSGYTGEEAHRRFEKALGLRRRFEYVDDDFILTGWSADPASVASRTGLK